MTEVRWTPSLVEERLAEAAEVLKALPEERVRGYFSTWPEYPLNPNEAYGWNELSLQRFPPSPAAIDRMEVAIGWLKWLEKDDVKIVWMRASGEPWRKVCWTVGLSRNTAHRHWLYALCVIAWRLRGRKVPRRSRRDVIRIVRGRSKAYEEVDRWNP